jgi:Uma2 family endonuclease
MTEVLAGLPARPLTLDDLPLLPDDGRRYEVVDGSLIVSPPPTPRHQLAASAMYDLLRTSAGSPWRVLAGGAGILLRDDRFLVPDLVVVRGEAARADTAGFLPSDVVLVVEVVSPSNAAHDLVLKRSLYAGHGIPHYWILDIRRQPMLHVLRLREGRYDEVSVGAEELAHLREPFPVSVRPAALLEWSG